MRTSAAAQHAADESRLPPRKILGAHRTLALQLHANQPEDAIAGHHADTLCILHHLARRFFRGAACDLHRKDTQELAVPGGECARPGSKRTDAPVQLDGGP